MQDLKIRTKDFFTGLTFKEDTHKYFVNGKKIKLSVSGLIEKYKHVVDWEEVLTNSSIKTGKSKEEIKKEWDKIAEEGCDKGDKAHLFGELYPYNRNLIPQTGMDKAIAKFWNDLPEHIVPFSLELKMYHKEFLFAGTADIILYNTKTNKIIIGDYKSNKDIFKNFKKQKMILGFEDLLCCPYNHYQIQLSYYQLLLEQVFGIDVHSRKLIWLKDDGTYLMYDTEDFTEKLEKDLKTIGVC